MLKEDKKKLVSPCLIRHKGYYYRIMAIRTGINDIKYVDAIKLSLVQGVRYESPIYNYIVRMELYKLYMGVDDAKR